MKQIQRILVPVDLSEECTAAIELATNLAKSNDAEIHFCYIALPPLPAEANYYQGDMEELIVREHGEFHQITPSDLSVEYKHVFVRGNPGPEIVRLAESKNCQMIVMATHGRTGLLRFVLGSVAEYVIRHSDVPVVTIKSPKETVSKADDAKESKAATEPVEHPISPFITSAMNHTLPIHEFDEMTKIISELQNAHCTAAPVVDGLGKCIGILTNTDIEKYQELAKRLDAKDQTVLDEVYDTSKYGMRILDRNAFHHVKKHMTAPVVTIRNDETCRDAEALFNQNKHIHHLIVLNENKEPIGVVEKRRLLSLADWNLEDEISV